MHTQSEAVSGAGKLNLQLSQFEYNSPANRKATSQKYNENRISGHKKTDLHKEYTFFGSSAISSGS
jgi:hypothetical protein